MRRRSPGWSQRPGASIRADAIGCARFFDAGGLRLPRPRTCSRMRGGILTRLS